MPSCKQSKLFITGLPRTGTSSLCYALLQQGFSVAHTAFTEQAIQQAQVIADTPVFSDFETLYQRFPDARFIQLERTFQDWLPSIRRLLTKLHSELSGHNSSLHPLIQHSFEKTFGSLKPQWSNTQLQNCYLAHQQRLTQFFSTLPENQHISVNIFNEQQTLENFLQLPTGSLLLPHLNQHGKINDWAKVKHPGKISSHLKDAQGRRKLPEGFL